MVGIKGLVALISVHPKYVQRIMQGEKKVEFRKKPFRRPVQAVAIYATLPIGKIVGLCLKPRTCQGSPSELWSKYKAVAGMTEEEFYNYYAGSRAGFAIELHDLLILDRPIDLKALSDRLVAPQNFSYLHPDIFQKIPELATLFATSRSQSAAKCKKLKP